MTIYDPPNDQLLKMIKELQDKIYYLRTLVDEIDARLTKLELKLP